MAREIRVAVVGATGAVGEEMRRVLQSRNFPTGELRFFTSPRSEGTKLPYADQTVTAEVLRPGCFDGVDLALFSAGATVSREWSPQAVASGAVVVDNSSAWRMDPNVPLVVPELNANRIPAGPAIIANPNCSTIQMVVALRPLDTEFGLDRVIAATYQSTSGAGRRAMNELENATRGYLAGEEPAPEKFPHPIPFNVVPQVDVFEEGGFTKEEWKMTNETRKIMERPDLPVVATCVRVPVFRGHSIAVWTHFRRPVDPTRAREVLAAFPGIVVEDDPARQLYPLARRAAETDPVYVGRLRRDPDDPNALLFWVVSDNLLKGAALNAVQIAEAAFRTR